MTARNYDLIARDSGVRRSVAPERENGMRGDEMTDDLDRKAALLMGWRYYYMPHHPYGYGRDEGRILAVLAPSAPQFNMPWEEVPEGAEFDVAPDMDHHIHPFRPTTTPADTRELVREVAKDFRVDITWLAGDFVQVSVFKRWPQVVCAEGYANPIDDGPNYDLIATVKACVVALESKEAQDNE
jgi:hypothetical protein